MQTAQLDHIRPVDQTVLELLRQYQGGDSRRPGSAEAVTHSAPPESPVTQTVAGAGPKSQEFEESESKISSLQPFSSTKSGPSSTKPGMTVPDLSAKLEVTATAVRQRLDRLVQCDLVERRKESVGRGRPQFRYCLTQLGLRYAAASYADLATALWQELLELPNPKQRTRVLRRVAKRMGEGLSQSIPKTGDITERMVATATALGRRKVAAEVNEQGVLPVLEVHSCPYPEIADNDESRQLCEMEQEMLSEAIGQAMQLDCCRLDGHNHCQFRPVGEPST